MHSPHLSADIMVSNSNMKRITYTPLCKLGIIDCAKICNCMVALLCLLFDRTIWVFAEGQLAHDHHG